MPKSHVIATSEHPGRADRIEFDIDFEAGQIFDLRTEGINATYAQRLLEGLKGRTVASFAWQQDYPTPDPFHDAKALAWHLMSRGWLVGGDLANIAWPVPDPLPKGAIA